MTAAGTEIQDVDLLPFAAWIDNALAEGAPVTVATALNGQPDVAFKGSTMVWDRDHLAFWERGGAETLAALRANPHVALLYRKAENGLPLRFYGVATLAEEGELRDRIWPRVNEMEQGRDPQRGGVGVLVRVDRVRRGTNVIQERRT